jgi:uncharacterized protein YdhG (YjbR/CyaY superfamily)
MRPVSHWLDLIAERGEARYPDLIDFLREEHGLSRTHANALVMHARGSTTSQQFRSLEDYLEGKDRVGASTVRSMFDGLVARHPGTRVTLAWNQPFLTLEQRRLFSVGVMARHLIAAPWSVEVLDAFRATLEERGLTVNRKTFRLPLAWTIDEPLLDAIVAAELRAE